MSVHVSATTDAAEFLDRTAAYRAAVPVETNVMTTVTTRAAAWPETFPGARWWIVERAGAVDAVAMCTPPQRLVVSPLTADAAAALADAVARDDPACWGVGGPEASVDAFLDAFTVATGRTRDEFPVAMRETLYVLGAHTPPRDVGGSLRAAAPDDAQWLSVWLRDFRAETGVGGAVMTQTDLVARLERRLMSLWLDPEGTPVAMAGRSTAGNVGRIGPVYTLPDARGRGYGAAITSAAIDLLHDDGCTTVMLYADQDYAPSNRVYLGLGFRPTLTVVETGVPPDPSPE